MSKLIIAFSILGLSGCKGNNPADPFESFNRRVHGFNKGFDQALFKPAAKTYKWILPSGLRLIISNILRNLHDIPVVANDLLQFKFKQAARDLGRLMINSSIGILGAADVATELKLPKNANQSFGNTLYQWGFKDSSYIIMPFLGPSTIRDSIGYFTDYFVLGVERRFRPKSFEYSVVAVDAIDIRLRLMDSEDLLDTISLGDEYITIRDAYLQHRDYELGKASPNAGLEDEDWD